MIKVLRMIFVCLTAVILASAGWVGAGWAGDAFDTPLNKWKISCKVDRGRITHNGNDWRFRPSKDYCGQGSKKMRSELASGRVRTDIKGAYLFHSTISIKSAAAQPFTLFQIHDRRPGCVPPLMMQVLDQGKIRLVSGIRNKPGKKCTHNVMYSPQKNGPNTAAIRLDGTPQELIILFNFNGRGGFDMTFRLDGTVFAKSTYTPTSAPGQKKAEVLYFKHGVYSGKHFDFQMTAKDMFVRKMDGRL